MALFSVLKKMLGAKTFDPVTPDPGPPAADVPEKRGGQIPLNSNDFLNFTTKAIVRKGLINADAAGWLAPYVQSIYQGERALKDVARTIRSEGRQLTPDEKKALGANTRANLGERIVAELTESGLKDPLRAIEYTLHAALFAAYRERDRLMHSKRPQEDLRFVVVSDDRTCQEALGLYNTVFKQSNAPSLPLPGCQADICRCSYQPCRRRSR